MNDYLENLKTKPHHVKKRFAFIVSFSFTFLVFAGWMASYGFNSSSVIAENVIKDGEEVIVETPVSSLTASAFGAWSDIKNLLFGSNKAEYSKDNVTVEAGSR
jgi:hypothetical protein